MWTQHHCQRGVCVCMRGGWVGCRHAWVDRGVWAFVTPHVWSVSVWLVSWLESFSPTFQCHLRCSCPRPGALSPQVYQVIQYLSIISSIAANHITLPLRYLYLSFLCLLTGLLLFHLFMFSDFCCFSISWPFLPHNQFAQHAHYLSLFASVAIVLEFNNHFRSPLLGNWGSGVCECVFLFSLVSSVCLSFSLISVCVCVWLLWDHSGETVNSWSTVTKRTPH